MTLDGPKTWHNVLLLLEGETVKLPAAKNIYSEDIVISTNVAGYILNKQQSYQAQRLLQ